MCLAWWKNSRPNVHIRVPAEPVPGPRDGRDVTQVNEGTAEEREVEALSVRNVESFLRVRARTRAVFREASVVRFSLLCLHVTRRQECQSRDTVGVESNVMG